MGTPLDPLIPAHVDFDAEKAHEEFIRRAPNEDSDSWGASWPQFEEPNPVPEPTYPPPTPEYIW